MTHFLDIQDRAIGLLGDAGEQRSPGFVCLDSRQKLIFGEPARDQSRLSPTRSDSLFWKDISTRPNRVNLSGARHSADLVWRHLQELQLDSLTAIALPVHYNDEQKALMGGILGSLGVSGALLVNRALLAAMQFSNAQGMVEMQLHQLVKAKYRRADGELSVQSVEVYPGYGLLGLVDMLMRHLQTLFIEKTRFDPMHQAVTEQSLFDQVLSMLDADPVERMEIRIPVKQSEQAVEFTALQMQMAIQTFVAKLLNHAPSADWLVDSLPPALAGYFEGYVDPFADNRLPFSLGQLAAAHADSEPGFHEVQSVKPIQNLRDIGSFESSVSAKSKATDAEPPEVPQHGQSKNLPTHLLCKGVALPLANLVLINQAGQLQLVEEKGEPSGDILARFFVEAEHVAISPAEGVRVNGQPLHSRRLLVTEDIISCDQAAGTLMAVWVGDHGR